MKKVILLMFLVFSGTIMAQDLTKKFQDSAKKDLEVLKSIVFVDESKSQLLFDFFYKKYKQYSIKSNSIARKEEIKKELEVELKSFFNTNEVMQLDKNKEILSKLVSE